MRMDRAAASPLFFGELVQAGSDQYPAAGDGASDGPGDTDQHSGDEGLEGGLPPGFTSKAPLKQQRPHASQQKS